MLTSSTHKSSQSAALQSQVRPASTRLTGERVILKSSSAVVSMCFPLCISATASDLCNNTSLSDDCRSRLNQMEFLAATIRAQKERHISHAACSVNADLRSLMCSEELKAVGQMAMGSLLMKVHSHMMPSVLGRWLEGNRTRVNQ